MSKSGFAAKLRAQFNANTKRFLAHFFVNKATGNAAIFSSDGQKELRSRVQNSKANGFSLSDHFEAANQIVTLFENATLVKTHDDVKHNSPNLKIERYLSEEVELQSGKKARACITVKHTLPAKKRILYSLELMEEKTALEKTRAKGKPAQNTHSQPSK